MPIIGRADIDIRALTDKFRDDIQKAVKGIKNVGIDVKVNADITDAQNKIGDLKKRSETNPIEVNVRADTKKLEDSLKKATEKVRPVKVGVSANVNDFKKSVRELNESVKDMKVRVPVYAAPKYFKRDIDAFVRNMKLNPVKIDVAVDPKALQNAVNSVQANSNPVTLPLQLDTTGAQAQAAAFTAATSALSPTMTPTTNTKAAAAQLAYLARTRRVPFVVQLERDFLRSLGGMAETLTGILPEKEIRKGIVNVTSNFSSMILKAGEMAAVFSALGTAGVSAFGGILAAGNDVARIIGIASMLPAVMTTGYLAMKTWTLSWKNFGAAAAGSAEAMAKLTPSARAAADAMDDVVAKIGPRVQETFWQQATDEMQTFARVVMPSVSNAMNDMALNMGNGMDGVLDAFINFGVESSEGIIYLNDALDNLGVGVAYITDAMRPLADVFITLAATGSKYMPAIGMAIRDAAQAFDDFIQTANNAGDIDRWILSGVDSFKQLISIVGSTVTIFGNMADAAERAGYGGIHSLAESLENVARASGDALVMERMTDVFAGAARGAEDLATGLGFVVDTLGRGAPRFAEFLELAGEIGRIGFENLNTLLNAEGLGDGLMTALRGFREGLAEVRPGFQAIGETIGNLGVIAGTMFQTMAPGFNNLALLIRDVVESLTGGLTAAMPVVNHFVDMWMQLLRLPIAGLAEGIGALLTVFSKLPHFMQNTIMAAAALAAVMRTLGAIGGASGLLKMAPILTGLVAKFAALRTAVALTAMVMKSGFASGGVTGAMSGMGTVALGLGKSFGMLALKATGIGLAMAAVEMAMSAYQESVGAAEANTAELTSAIDQYGASSTEAAGATEKVLSSSKSFAIALGDQIKSFGGLREVSNMAGEGFEKLGWDVEDVSAAINKSGGEWTAYREKLEALREGTGRLGSVSEELSQSVLGTGDAAGMTRAQVNEMINSYDTANRAVEESSAAQEKAAEAARKSAEFNAQVAEAIGTLSPKLVAAADGYKVLGDASSSADDKMSALQATMAYVQSAYDTAGKAIQNSAQVTQADTDAKMTNAAATDTINGSIAALSTTYGQVGTSILNAKGGLNELNPTARQVYDNLSNVSTQIQEVGIRTYDAALKGGASVQAATDKAMGAMEPMIGNIKDQLRAMGITGDEAINTVLRQVGLLPTDLRMAINAEGNAAEKAMQLKLIVEGLVSGNYDIALGAVDKGAMKTIAEASGAGQAYADGDYEAVFKAIADDIGVVEAAKFMEETAGKDYEAIMDLYAEDYATEDINKALKAGGALDGTEFSATITAIDKMKDVVKDKIGQLQDLDNIDPDVQLKAITDQFDQKTRDALAKTLELENANPETILAALDQASPTVLEALGLAKQFDGQVSEATLKALDEATPEAIDALAELQKINGSSHEARISAVSKIPETVQKDIAELLKIENASPEAIITALDRASPAVAEAVRKIQDTNNARGEGTVDAKDLASDKAKNAGLNIQENATAEGIGTVGVRGAEDTIAKANGASEAIKGVGGAVGQGALSVAGAEVVQQKAANAGQAVTGFSLFRGDATVGITDEATPVLDPITGQVTDLGTKNVSPQVNLGGSPAAVREDLDHIQRKLDDIGNKNPQPSVTMQGGAQAVTELQNIVSKTSALSGMQATPRVIVSGADSAQAQISTVVSRVSALSGMQATPRVILSGTGAALAQIGSVIGRMQALAGTSASPRIILQGHAAAIAQIGSVIGRMQALAGTTAQPRIILQGGPAALAGIAGVLSRLNHLGSSTANPRIVLQGGPAAISGVAAVQRVFDALNRSTARPRIDMQGARAAESAVQSVQRPLDHLSRTTATPSINLSGASGANSEIDSVRNNLASLDGDTAVTHVITRHRTEKAHGGLINGAGATTFANGGIMKAMSKVESFANGGVKMPTSFGNGVEQHTAQIAKGKWPVRVWAEPETGGEAYIPLHINKRARSLDILNQVAEMFGFSLVKKFADGGILNSISANSSGGSFADGGFHKSGNVSGYVAGTRNRTSTPSEIASVVGSGDNVVINNHVYPSAQLDERQVADSVSRDLFWRLMNK